MSTLPTVSSERLYLFQECGICGKDMDTSQEDVVLREPRWYHRSCWLSGGKNSKHKQKATP